MAFFGRVDHLRRLLVSALAVMLAVQCTNLPAGVVGSFFAGPGVFPQYDQWRVRVSPASEKIHQARGLETCRGSTEIALMRLEICQHAVG